MPKWIYNRPPGRCDETETRVAKILNRLPNDWIVKWGFYYSGDHEGDFLVCGPDGTVLVLEVKGGDLRRFATTGSWETHDEKGDHPFNQLNREWKSVLLTIQEKAGSHDQPFVSKALALPDVYILPTASAFRGIDREYLLDADDLDCFEDTWKKRITPSQLRCDRGHARRIFIDSFSEEGGFRRVGDFISETDKILLRHLQQEYVLLDMLAGNARILIQGGPGTGKTWMAIEQAFRSAEAGIGQDVLFLCYNLALEKTLSGIIGGRKLKRGTIAVKSWETLAREIFRAANHPWEVPALEQQIAFYSEFVPRKLAEIVARPSFKPAYDCLIVDEAQDHDTLMNAEEAGLPGGWWATYIQLLRRGAEAQVYAFFDPWQRPYFRHKEKFNVEALRTAFPIHAFINLPFAIRYSRPIFAFLKNLKSSGTDSLVESIKSRQHLLEGPVVNVLTVTKQEVRDAIGDIITTWIGEGYCKADDILILSSHGTIQKSALAGTERIRAWKLVPHESKQPGDLGFLSINKAKGLDSLAVIMIDVKPFAEIQEPQAQLDYFMGASRARQLLAIVETRVVGS